MLMKKLLFTLVALLATMTTFAQTNLTSGKTVVPLGGLKSFQPEDAVTVDKLQKITTDGNTDNVFLFPENGANLEANKLLGIQGFYIDLGASKSIGAIQSTWEGADCGANIYVTDTEPAADGTLTGETLIATFTNAQEATKNAAVEVANSGRYIVFVPTEATNYSWGVKIRTFVALEKQASVLTTLEVSPSMVKVGEATEMTFTAKDQLGLTLTEGVTYTATNAILEGTMLTATAVGDVVVTATMGDNSATATIKAINVSAPTENPTEPTDLAANVIAVYSAKYDKGINESNPTWGVGGGAPNPLYTSVEEVVIANDHKAVHVKGTGFNSRTAGGVGITSDYTKIHVALYPFTATEAKLFGDNAYGDALTVENLVPGQWNYVEIDNPGNQPNYMLVELVGETEFYLDHFYFAKPAADDSEAPTLETAELVSAGIGCATLKLKATDDKSAQVTYVINDGTKDYTTKGDKGTEITYTIGGLAFGQAYTLSIVAQDDNENKSAAQQIEVTTLALAAAPVPTQAAADVISIYSNAYTGTGYAYGGWGQSTVVADEQVDNDDMLKLTNYNYLGFEFTTQLDLSEMEYLHIDVLPLQDMSLGITPIMTGAPTENSTSVGTLVPGQWNSCDIKLSDLGLDYANYKAFQLKLDKGTGTEIVYVDNIYFWKSAGGEVPTTEITALSVTAEATSIEAGATTQLTVKDQDNNAVAADQITFSSSDETVATVNENGVVTGVAEGSAIITATLNSDETIKNTVEITVTAATPVATSGEGSYLIPSGVNAGKELKYSWAFSQTGMDVTVTFALTGTDEIAGIVDGYVFNKTDGFQEIGGLTYTWTNCTEGQTLTAAHKWMFAEGDFVTPDYSYTVKESQGGEVPTTEKTVYLNPAIWEVNGEDSEWNEAFAAYVFGDGLDASWLTMDKVDDTPYYTVAIPASYTGLIFTRRQVGTEMNWDNVWNQTVDIDFTSVEDNTLFTITAWHENDDESKPSTVESTLYVEPTSFTVTFKNSIGWENVYAYTYNSETLGAWPGKAMTIVDGVYTISFKAVAAPANIIFNNGGSGEGNQTDDLVFENGKEYDMAAPVVHEGTPYTADGKTIYVVANHYTGTDNYEVIITSDDVMNGLGGSFWNINGVGGTRVDANMTISSDGKTLMITATSNPEQELYTPLYVMMPGEVNFGQIVFDWQEIGGSEPTLDTTALETEINAAKALLGSAAIDVDPGKALNDAIANAEQVKQDATTQSDIDQAVTDLKAAEAAYTTATGISRIVLDAGADAIYTIDGRRVENPTRGIYIIDGKKVVIK